MNGKRLLFATLIAAAAGLSLLLKCSNIGGTGEETTNGMVVGMVVNQNGDPVAQTAVALYPADYDPVKDSRTIPVVMTDDSGKYQFPGIPYGTYTIVAVQSGDRTRAMVSNIGVAVNRTLVPTATLRNCGTIKVTIPANADTVSGYVYVQGTDIVASLSGNSSGGFAILDSVPSGAMPSVNYGATSGPLSVVIRYAVQVPSGDTATIMYPSWKYARLVCLNTTPTGAAVAGTVTGFPVCIRLTNTNFAFRQAQKNGQDLRFTKSDGTPLFCEIERWDSVAGAAEIWVKVDTVYGNDSTHGIGMYWGNDSTSSASNSAAAFDTADRFQGVWHLGQTGGTTANDATGNHYDGTPYGMTAASAVPGIIGMAQQFNGTSSYFQMLGTANSRLNFPESGTYSLSVWVNADSIDTLPHVIVSKGHEDYYLKLMSNASTANQWEFVEYHDKKGWDITEDTVQARTKTWTYLVGVRNGAKQYLYRDGVFIDSTVRISLCDSARTETDNFSIGRYLRPATFVNYEGMCTFRGVIDEVRVSSTVPSADWIRLCYMNQKASDALVSFR
jgi:hypothetical protein